MKNSRYNLHTLIHKGVCASLCQSLVDLQKLDDTNLEVVSHSLDITASLLKPLLSSKDWLKLNQSLHPDHQAHTAA